MRRIVFVLSVSVFPFLFGCQKGSTVEPASSVQVEGNWRGTLGSGFVDMAFIEGHFEGAQTMTGTVRLIIGNEASIYRVMNGLRNQAGSIEFSLYRVPVVGTEEYDLKGTVSGRAIIGTYRALDQKGGLIRSGTWHVYSVP